ncbi:MAG: hypothetical protein IIX52_07315 [Paludibacteraceae bacterium]|nr:hypothetical protein [Paludibacteraceae bacterium]
MSFLLFIGFIFLCLIVGPIIRVLIFLSRSKNANRQQTYQQPSNNQQTQHQSPVNKRFDKSKAEDVEFEEVK